MTNHEPIPTKPEDLAAIQVRRWQPEQTIEQLLTEAINQKNVVFYWSQPLLARRKLAFEAIDFLIPHGKTRFDQAKLWAQTRFERIFWQFPSLAAVHCMFAAFAFLPTLTTQANVWSLLPTNWLVLPKYVVVEEAGERHASMIDQPTKPFIQEALLALPTPAQVFSQQQEHWLRAVDATLEKLKYGELEKVVLARARAYEASPITDIPAFIKRLETDFPTCTIYCIGVHGCYFVGATPERLIAKQGLNLQTAALAGTASNTEKTNRMVTAHELPLHQKNLQEHRYVVYALQAALQQFTNHVQVEAMPHLHHLAQLSHLETHIKAQLTQDIALFDLVGALHPSPAVAGTPTTTSLAWIEQVEHFNRGWYSSPLGWIDAQNNGDFAVALRGILTQPNQAYAFAGAGIVAQSDPVAEWQETELKLAAIEQLLG